MRIYNHYVASSHATFDIETFSVEGRSAWFAAFAEEGPHRLLVAERGGGLVGYACSLPFKPKPAYSVSVETTVYVDASAVGQGLGRQLMTALLGELAGNGLHGAYAGIALPNAGSTDLHESLGFRHVGTLREVGRKFDRYWDVAWYERRLDP